MRFWERAIVIPLWPSWSFGHGWDGQDCAPGQPLSWLSCCGQLRSVWQVCVAPTAKKLCHFRASGPQQDFQRQGWKMGRETGAFLISPRCWVLSGPGSWKCLSNPAWTSLLDGKISLLYLTCVKPCRIKEVSSQEYVALPTRGCTCCSLFEHLTGSRLQMLPMISVLLHPLLKGLQQSRDGELL